MNTENLNYPNDPGSLGQFWHPEDVVADTRLSKDEKRALLAAWASDERTVPGDPTLRQLPNGAVVGLTSILDALRALDASEHNRTRPTTSRYPDHRHDRILTKWRRRHGTGSATMTTILHRLRPPSLHVRLPPGSERLSCMVPTPVCGDVGQRRSFGHALSLSGREFLEARPDQA